MHILFPRSVVTNSRHQALHNRLPEGRCKAVKISVRHVEKVEGREGNRTSLKTLCYGRCIVRIVHFTCLHLLQGVLSIASLLCTYLFYCYCKGGRWCSMLDARVASCIQHCCVRSNVFIPHAHHGSKFFQDTAECDRHSVGSWRTRQL